MAGYDLVFKESVFKDLRPIPNKNEKLSGQDRYRIRDGNGGAEYG